MRTTMGTARKHHLDRAARIAGEAFAFEEPDNTPAVKSNAYASSLMWLLIAAVAILGLAYAL